MIVCIHNEQDLCYNLSLGMYFFKVPFTSHHSEDIANLFLALVERMNQNGPGRRECETTRENTLAFFNLMLAVERNCGSKVLGILEGSVLA